MVVEMAYDKYGNVIVEPITVPLSPGINIDVTTGKAVSGTGGVTSIDVTEGGITYRISYVNGREVAKIAIGSTTTKTTGSSGGGGGGGGGYSAASLGSVNDVKDYYAKWYGDAWVSANMGIINKAANNHWTERQILSDIAQRGANDTPYARSVVNYIRSVCGPLPLGSVMQIVGSGMWLESDFATRIAPQYQTDVLSNPQSLAFMQAWNEYTGGATFGPTAQAKLKEITDRFGYTPEAQAQWQQWLTTTESANNGNYGAEKRAIIGSYVTSWLGREPTEEELSQSGPYWKLIDGPLGSANTAKLQETIRGSDEYKTRFAAKLPGQSEADYLGWEASINSIGNWYFNDRPGIAGEPYVNNFTGYTPEELIQLNKDGWTSGALGAYYQAIEEAAYDQGVYGPIVEEAFGSTAGIDWFVLANGGQGSGAMRAKIVEAQQRVQFREAYRQVFGSDPSPADYDRVSNEYVSPAELIRETQALESADEMYDQVNDLLTRVFGETVTKEELKDMVLGRPNSGELKARINEATTLEAYRTEFKTYEGREPTPDDYAKFKGYSGVAEYKWDITTAEAMKELGPTIREALGIAFPDEPALTDEELRIMVGDMKGSGELKAKYREAQEIVSEKEKARDWEWQQPGVERDYMRSEQGGFRESVPGIANL